VRIKAVEMLYADPALDVTNLCLEDGDQFNRASKKLHLNMFITQLDEIGVDVEQYHKQNQNNWHMPEKYKAVRHCRIFVKTVYYRCGTTACRHRTIAVSRAKYV
jgi:hypothetical protein